MRGEDVNAQRKKGEHMKDEEPERTTERTGKGIERKNEKEREREGESIQPAEALTQRGKSPKRKPLTTSTGWKKNRLWEPRGEGT